jgi:hypothetical protein
MQRWFLSFHSPDQGLAERIAAAIERRDDGANVFLAHKSLPAGGYWQKALAEEIARADVFLLLIGPSGIGSWQVTEYNEAQQRSVKESGFPIVLLLLEGQSAPGLPFLRQFNWIVSGDPTSEKDLGRLISAAAGAGLRPTELWRYTAPYRGLAAMEEKDSDYFFGREHETVEVLKALAAAPDKLPVLLGNSGVGKSSLAQAGVIAALRREAWPERASGAGAWPPAFGQSRAWCFLTVKPGGDPLKALVDPFLKTWQFDPTDPRRETRRAEWIKSLRDGRNSLRVCSMPRRTVCRSVARPSQLDFLSISTRARSCMSARTMPSTVEPGCLSSRLMMRSSPSRLTAWSAMRCNRIS